MGYVLSITELQFSASALFLHSFRVAFYIHYRFCRAIAVQLNVVEELHDNPLWMRIVEGTQDFDTILKAFRNVSSLCEVFQVSLAND